VIEVAQLTTEPEDRHVRICRLGSREQADCSSTRDQSAAVRSGGRRRPARCCGHVNATSPQAHVGTVAVCSSALKIGQFVIGVLSSESK
jgi:hypothetical protein